LLDTCLGLPLSNAIDLSGKKQMFSYREVVEEPEALRQNADATLDLKRICSDIKPADGGLAGSGSQ
jgi:hypothetical protein